MTAWANAHSTESRAITWCDNARLPTLRRQISQHLKHRIDRAGGGALAGADGADAVHPGVFLRTRFEVRRDTEIIQTGIDRLAAIDPVDHVLRPVAVAAVGHVD